MHLNLIYTSGEGSVYPGGIYIGVVENVELDGYSRTKTAKVKVAVDFGELRYVVVVTGYESGGEGK